MNKAMELDIIKKDTFMKPKYLRKWIIKRDRNGKIRYYIVVETLNHEKQCSCKGWIFRRIPCRHINMVNWLFLNKSFECQMDDATYKIEEVDPNTNSNAKIVMEEL